MHISDRMLKWTALSLVNRGSVCASVTRDPVLLGDGLLDDGEGHPLHVHELVGIEGAGGRGVEVPLGILEEDDAALGVEVLDGQVHEVLEERVQLRERVDQLGEPVEGLEVLLVLGDREIFQCARRRVLRSCGPFQLLDLTLGAAGEGVVLGVGPCGLLHLLVSVDGLVFMVAPLVVLRQREPALLGDPGGRRGGRSGSSNPPRPCPSSTASRRGARGGRGRWARTSGSWSAG